MSLLANVVRPRSPRRDELTVFVSALGSLALLLVLMLLLPMGPFPVFVMRVTRIETGVVAAAAVVAGVETGLGVGELDGVRLPAVCEVVVPTPGDAPRRCVVDDPPSSRCPRGRALDGNCRGVVPTCPPPR